MLEDLAVQSLLTINISLTCANQRACEAAPGSTAMYDERTPGGGSSHWPVVWHHLVLQAAETYYIRPRLMY